MASRRIRRRGSNAILYAGLFLAFSGALLTGLYFIYGKLERSWRGVAEMRVLFTKARSLQPGAPVLYDGMEVGRVKNVSIVHVGSDLLTQLPPLTKRDLHNLPISDDDREAFARMDDAQVNAALKSGIEGRMMVLAVFDVLIDRDEKRLREDDAYFIATSKIGDSRIEIVTGRGKSVVPRPGMVVLGVDADLISDIGKNLEQIQDILYSIANIIGGDAGKAAVQDQLRNFEGFTANLEKQTASMVVRVPQVWDEIDLRIDDSEKNVNEITDKILAIFPKVDAAVAKAGEAIDKMHGTLSKSAESAVDKLHHYRQLAKDEVAHWNKLSGEYRVKTPARLKELRKTAESALDAIAKLDEVLSRVEVELKLSTEHARMNLDAQSESAMSVQELAWNFKKSPGYFSSKYTREQLQQRHLAWRFDMARKQYIELRRELAALQPGTATADPADRERSRMIEEKLVESDAFFNINRADFIPGETPKVIIGPPEEIEPVVPPKPVKPPSSDPIKELL